MIQVITTEEDKIIEKRIEEYEAKHGNIKPIESRKSLYWALLGCLREHNVLPEVDQIERKT